MGPIQLARHRIELTLADTSPIHATLYPAGPKARELDRNQIEKMLELRVIELFQTEWASPI